MRHDEKLHDHELATNLLKQLLIIIQISVMHLLQEDKAL